MSHLELAQRSFYTRTPLQIPFSWSNGTLILRGARRIEFIAP